MSDHTAVLPEFQPESRRSTRGLVAVVASVVAVVLIAGGGFAAWQFFFSGGTHPAEVLPASTFALVTVDLDPSGGQKVEAIKTLRKFPSWRKRTGVTPDSDVLKALFEKTLDKGPCKSLDYEQDLKPWIGQRAGLGGVDLGGKTPSPVLALQVKNAYKAKSGFAELAKCSGVADDDDFGWTIAEDYVVVSDSKAHAEDIVAAGRKSPLSENGDFQKWTNEAGGAGIVNAYVSRKSIGILADSVGSDLASLTTDGLLGDDPGAGSDPEDEILKSFKDFQGAAAVLKFNDGGIDLSFAGGGAKQAKTRTVGDHVGSLPRDTAAVLALAVPEDLADRLKKDGGSLNDLLGETFGSSTGIDLPDDLITVLGSSLSVSLGGDAPADLDDISEPADVPVGLVVHGDEKKIQAVIDKVEARTGSRLSDLPAALATGDGLVAIASSPGYADDLVKKGSLSDSADFKDVVTHVDEAHGVLFVSFDNEWTDAYSAMSAKSKDADAIESAADFAQLRALGLSSWTEADTTHGLVRLALK
ncbi:MAG: hypothetical protein JWR85_432 [Marmoricola sp.]|nr:hypothetical protein [Marmoricola sp.]